MPRFLVFENMFFKYVMVTILKEFHKNSSYRYKKNLQLIYEILYTTLDKNIEKISGYENGLYNPIHQAVTNIQNLKKIECEKVKLFKFPKSVTGSCPSYYFLEFP